MALHLRPVGPLPAATYWRRRGAVALAVLVLLTLLGRCGGDDPQDSLETTAAAPPPASAPPSAYAPSSISAPPTPLSTPLSTPMSTPLPSSPATSPSPTADAGPPVCPDAQLRVVATADRASYPVGATPRLRLAVRNIGTTPCRRELGQGAVELAVVSGRDRVWSSDDCAPGGPAGETVLAPGETSSTTLVWQGKRSAKGCPDERVAATAGSYRLVARVGTFRRPGAVFRLTES